MKAARLFMFVALLFSTCLLATNALAFDRSGTLTVSPMIGGYTFEGNEKLKTSMVYRLSGGYCFTDNFGVEAGLGFIDTGLTGGSPDRPLHYNIFGSNLGRDSVQVDGYIYNVDAVYHLPQIWKLSPYLAAGAGGLTLDPENGKARTRAMIDYGGGLEFFVVDRLAIRGDVRHVITFNETYNNVMYTAGLIYYIGGLKPAPAPVAATPPPPPPAPAPAPKKVEAPAPPPRQAEVCIDLKVMFDFDKDDVKPEYYDDIKRVAEFLKSNPTFHGTIEGGTDAVGSEDYNQGLSERRAESVKKVLVDNFGIAPERLKTVGYGKVKPIATNLTAEGRQINRRAVRVYCSSGEDLPLVLQPQKCIVLKVNFAVGSATVDPDKYADAFKEISDYMKAHPNFVGTVEGYTDASGPAQLNMDLSMKRAENVKKVLVEKYGVPADRLRAEGYGKERPINSNESIEGRAANRYAVQVICEPEAK